MPSGVGRLCVQRRCDQLDKRLIDFLELIHEDRIVQQNAREPCQRLKQRRHLIWKHDHLAGAFLKVIEQLQHTDNSAYDSVVARLRTISSEILKSHAFIEFFGARKIELIRAIDIINLHRLPGVSRKGDDIFGPRMNFFFENGIGDQATGLPERPP